jgi:Major Facilitator Superfamily
LFCITNILTIQQILIRYDALALQSDSPPLFNYYMKSALRPTKKKNSRNSTPFRRILHHDELDQLANHLIMEWNVLALSQSSKTSSALTDRTINTYIDQFQSARHLFKNTLSSLQSTTDGTTLLPVQHDVKDRISLSSSYDNIIPNIFSSIHDSYQSLIKTKTRIGLEPADLSIRENQHSLTKQIEHLVQWRFLYMQQDRQKNNYGESATLYTKADSTSSLRNKSILSKKEIYHLALNLFSGFLYCMNYYIVEPSSTMYVNRFNANDAMSGTLIGMMPLAAFLSAIPYSYGTNQSFRYPFLISCGMLVLGNIIYSIADILGHLYIALMGRFVCGLGAPKCIIRRFMADSTPMRLRTSVNALYAMVLGVGSALGPFMAVLLNRYDFTMKCGPVIVALNGLTLPGYFMASLWLVFFFLVLLTFEEPNRDGLHEQKELETQIKNKSSSVSTETRIIDANAATDDDRSTCNNSESNSSVFSYDSSYNFDAILKTDSLFYEDSIYHERFGDIIFGRLMYNITRFISRLTLPVIICLGLLFAKVFTIEALVSATSTLTKNRYGWQVQQVGTLGFVNGLVVIPFSILVGKLAMIYQDHILMKWLVLCGCIGLFQLIDFSDIWYGTPTATFNEEITLLAVSPKRYILGYFMAYISIQAFEGVIGSTLSKVIPTSLASGTFNSGLLATLVDTFGRACGDLFISAMGYISLRQLMNLLFIPGFLIMLTCLVVIERCCDLLAV